VSACSLDVLSSWTTTTIIEEIKLSQKYKEIIAPSDYETSYPQINQAVENFIQDQLQDYTNDQVIKKVIQQYGKQYENLAVSILNKFKQQSL